MRVMKTPKAVDLTITDRCNLRCKYCGHFTSAGNVGKDLSTREWLEFFEELNRCAVMRVTLSGGEPFYREDIKEIIEGIIRNRMRFSVLSNGTLITDEIASFLASTKRCDSVQVSIDSSIPTTHDAFRGRGSFFKAMRGIKYLQKHKVPVTVRVTINRKNVRELEDVTALLLEEVGLPSFSTNAAMYMGLCRQNAEEIQLTTQERVLATKTLLRLNRKYNGRISASAGPLDEGRNWSMMEKWRQEGRKSVPGRGFLTSCGGVMSKLGVRADGVMVPCTQLSNIELGRINQDDLKEVWQNHPELNRFRERCNIELRSFEFCRGCDHIDYCAGGCPATAYTLVGDYHHPSPDGCLRLFLRDGGTLPDEKLLENACTGIV